MNLEVIGRHIDVTSEVRDFVSKRADKLGRFFDRVHSLKVVLGVEGAMHHAEFVAHLIKGEMVIAKAVGSDVYNAVEVAADKLENQLKKYKEKLRDHRARPEQAGGPEEEPEA